MLRTMNIGDAARAAGVSAKMIRHAEQTGLLPSTGRSASGYRQFTDHDVNLLRFIRRGRLLGFSTPQIASLVGLWSDSRRSSREVKRVAQEHLQDLDTRIGELQAVRDALADLVAVCQGDDQPHCAILDRLSDGTPDQAPPRQTPRLRPPQRQPRTPAAAASAANSSSAGQAAADLMAWSRRVGRPST